MSMTGTNADVRTMISPSEEGKVAAGILSVLKGGTVSNLDAKLSARIKAAANALSGSKGESLLIAGTNDLSTQTIVAAINQLLGNYGTTIDLERPSQAYRGDESAAAQLIADMNSGKVSTLITYGCNCLLYTSPSPRDQRGSRMPSSA